MLEQYKYAEELLLWEKAHYPEWVDPPTPDICYSWHSMLEQDVDQRNRLFLEAIDGKNVLWAIDEMGAFPPVVISGMAMFELRNETHPPQEIRPVAFIVDFSWDFALRLLLFYTSIAQGVHEWPRDLLPKGHVYEIFDEFEERMCRIMAQVAEGVGINPWIVDWARLVEGIGRFRARLERRIQETEPMRLSAALRSVLQAVRRMKVKASDFVLVRKVCLAAEVYLKRMIEKAPK